MYIVGDLLLCAMIFGREHSVCHHCYQCRLSSREFSNLVKQGEPLTHDLLIILVETVRNGKLVEGCKVKTWWQFIKVQNDLVPLLHKLIGISNNILNHVKDTVNEGIECLDLEAIAIWRKVGVCKQMTDVNVLKKDGWKENESR